MWKKIRVPYRRHLSPLTPQLKDFIQRILVPILVDRYLEERKRGASERL